MITVLVVDDDVVVVRLCTQILSGLENLNILQAFDGDQAIRIAADLPERIDLLLSDVIMQHPPDGIEVAESITMSRPEMKVLLMSGARSEDSVALHGWQFLGKPFLPSTLVSKIEETLERPLYRRVRTMSGR